MKSFTKTLALAGLALSASLATPAAAQVEGKVATASVSRALLGVNPLMTALSQVSTTYATQLEQLESKQKELNTLLTPYDTNGNGSIDQNEAPGLQAAPNFQQIQTLRGEIANTENQVTAAQVYAVEQVLAQYQTAITEVANAQQIVMVVDPSSLQFAGEGADITAAISASLTTKVPNVGIVPPQGWQPNPNSVQVFQEIQRRILIQQARAQAAQQQQQQQGNAQAPAGR